VPNGYLQGVQSPRKTGTRRSTAIAVVLLCLAFGVSAGAGQSANGATTEPENLASLLLTPTQIGPGYRLVQRPDGTGLKGLATLDMCGYRFGSEKLRLSRLQVNYVHSGRTVTLSNEIVAYQPGGAVQALEEVAYAAAHCPGTPLRSVSRGVSSVSFHVSPVPLTEPLPAGSLAYAITISLTYKGRLTEQNDIVVYQIRGNVLSGVYGYGGTLAARTKATLASAMMSSKNLRQIEVLPANVA
jgi:hypothetical protein